MSSRVAVIQSPPVMLDRDKSIAQVVELITQAAATEAQLLVFPEAYIGGYPTWAWRLRPGADMSLAGDIHAALRQSAVDLANDDLAPVRAAAAQHAVTVVLGINELDSEFSGSTLYNSVVVIGADGSLLNHHRKLMPTNPERMIWGMGDARGLRVVDTPAGRLGCLICWESLMPLARYALCAQGMDILVNPTWDHGETALLSSRHIAREAGCWVIATATAMQGNDVPENFPGRDTLFNDDEWINDGDAVVIAPGGAIAAGPLHREKGILYAEIDAEAARRARRSLDISGHYARPDVFSLSVNRQNMAPVSFDE